MIKLLDAQDVTLDTFWQELFYATELGRLCGAKGPDDSAVTVPRREREGGSRVLQ